MIRIGDRIKFRDESKWYRVRAVSADQRYAVATYPAFGTVIYTLIDFADGVRGVDNSIGNSLGYETDADCAESLARIVCGDFGFSERRRPIPLSIERIKLGQ